MERVWADSSSLWSECGLTAALYGASVG